MHDHIKEHLTLGEKIKNFRKRAGYSQLDLEIEINAAPGSISRIEAGRVNPTKETLLAICGALRLTITERAYLTGVEYDEVQPEELASVLKKTLPVLTQESFLGYLLDDKDRVVAISSEYEQLLKSFGVDTSKLINKSMLEIVFNPELGIRGVLPEDKFETLALRLLGFLNQEWKYKLHETWWQELLNKLRTFEGFNILWEKVQRTEIDIYSSESRTIYFKVGDVEIKTRYSLTPVFSDPRFTIAEYTVLQ